ncbi:hypothetical protein OFN94_37840, partial [Escherichia coli]|nr:hypothetical protein [Escherichia coli]
AGDLPHHVQDHLLVVGQDCHDTYRITRLVWKKRNMCLGAGGSSLRLGRHSLYLPGAGAVSRVGQGNRERTGFTRDRLDETSGG